MASLILAAERQRTPRAAVAKCAPAGQPMA
jgi:hypothetical protein